MFVPFQMAYSAIKELTNTHGQSKNKDIYIDGLSR